MTPAAAEPRHNATEDAGEHVIPAFSAGAVPSPRQPRLGAILVEAGRLKPRDAERIHQLQRQNGARFGEAGRQLGLLKPADVEFALSVQFDCPVLVPGETRVSESLVAAFAPSRPEVEALRALRTQLMLRWFDHDPPRKALALISAAPQEGRSFIAANLAVVFAQLGERTLLIDGDFRNPAQHRLFGLDNRLGLSAMLSSRAGPEAIQRIAPWKTLFVLPAGAPPPNPQELLARPALVELLNRLSTEVDVILLDTPAAGQSADAQILAVRAGAALIVTRRDATRAWRVQGISGKMLEAKATIVGAVLNDY